MPRFSEQSLSRLSTCHIDLQTLFAKVIKHFDCIVLEGHRGQEAQDKAFAEGKSKLKWPNGNHNSSPSMAVDVAPYPIDWTDAKQFHWFAGFVMGVAEGLKAQDKITHSIRWGGAWNGLGKLNKKGLMDLPHYEIVP